VLAGLTAAGCVLPIGPEFEPERNMPPFVVRAEPPVGSIIRDPNQVFQVTVEDPNRLDDLHIRWLIDYPPFNENITRTALAISVGRSGPDKPNQHPLPFKPECVHLISPTLSQHTLLLVISDRPFVDDTVGSGGERILDQVRTGAFRLPLSWTFEKECP
jgi:hypothetical protein